MKKMQHFNKTAKQKKSGGRAILILPAVLCITAAATASASYWTDIINLDAGVDTLDVGISYESDDLTLDTEKFIPGDSKDIDFTVNNSGDISVDIKPVISITADSDMKKNASSFILTNDDGSDADDFDVSYYDEELKKLDDSDIDGGKTYRVIKYTLKDNITLAGSVQNDEEDETETNKEFSYKLKLSEQTKNDFIGATADVNVSTYAIQHRNRSGGTGEWIEDAQKIEKNAE